MKWAALQVEDGMALACILQLLAHHDLGVKAMKRALAISDFNQQMRKLQSQEKSKQEAESVANEGGEAFHWPTVSNLVNDSNNQPEQPQQIDVEMAEKNKDEEQKQIGMKNIFKKFLKKKQKSKQ